MRHARSWGVGGQGRGLPGACLVVAGGHRRDGWGLPQGCGTGSFWPLISSHMGAQTG